MNTLTINALLQVNAAEEESKYGLKMDEVILSLGKKILEYDSIKN